MQLNLANGTFTILDATLKDTSFSGTVLDTLTQNGVKVDFYGCALSGKNQITCDTKVTSLNKDQAIGVVGESSSKLFDNLSNEYKASTITALDKSGAGLIFNIIQGIPVEVKFIYNSINPSATSISTFKPQFYTDSGTPNAYPFIADFRDIEF